ncbi:MAG TPA: phospholipid carrier-dependent glycosyltransferase, partial [Candidatus Marinimicrobia bacterium]|nr:phospholipid carrier-dependent glycosyltransferase [Candidatus Neomarinimicrobiota bacterium]
VFLYRFGKTYFNEATGIIMSLGISANMLFHTNAVVITPDVPLAFFTIMAIIYYYKAYFIDAKYLYAAGILLGLAVLSKVSALFPAVGIILFPFVIQGKRHFLSDIRFYGSLVAALLVFIPFIIWNLQNDLAFVRYQGSHVTSSGSWSDFRGLWLSLLVTIGPVFFYYSVIKPFLLLKRLLSISPELTYFTIVTIVPATYFLMHSVFSRMEVNWPAPIFSGGLFLFGILLGENWPVYRKRFIFQVGFSLVLIFIVTVQTFWPFLPIKGKIDVTNRYHIYNAFPSELKAYLQAYPELQNKRLLADNYQIPSMINFYLNPSLEASALSINYHETLYSFLYQDGMFVGKDFLFLKRGKTFPKKFTPYFDDAILLQLFESKRLGQKVAGYSLWSVTNYRGKSTANSL